MHWGSVRNPAGGKSDRHVHVPTSITSPPPAPDKYKPERCALAHYKKLFTAARQQGSRRAAAVKGQVRHLLTRQLLHACGLPALHCRYEVERRSDGGRYALKHVSIEDCPPEERTDLVTEIRFGACWARWVR